MMRWWSSNPGQKPLRNPGYVAYCCVFILVLPRPPFPPSNLLPGGSDLYLPKPPPPPHMGVFVASRRPPVPDDPPCWNVHSSQVTVAQRLRHLLDHHYLVSEVEVHEMFAESSHDVSYYRAPWYRTLHLL